jgi:hypothetical protein
VNEAVVKPDPDELDGASPEASLPAITTVPVHVSTSDDDSDADSGDESASPDRLRSLLEEWSYSCGLRGAEYTVRKGDHQL